MRCLLPADALLADWPKVAPRTPKMPGASSPACAAASTLPDAPQVRVYGPEPGAFLGTRPHHRPAN